MKHKISITGTALISLVLLAGCAKDVETTDVTGVDAPGSVAGDEVSGAGDTDEAVQFDVNGGTSGTGGTQSSSGDVDPLSVRTVYFGYDEAIISEQAQTIIRAHAEVLMEIPDASLNISGHADERGTREYNLALGDQRAEAVSNYFQQFGIDASRISVTSYGEESPAAMGSDESSWQLNRRAEFDY